MRKRTHGLLVYFSETELAELQRKSAESGLSCSAFIRRAVAGKDVKQVPPADIPILIRDIRRVGHNVNPLLTIANATHLLDAPQMRKVLAQTYLAADAVVKAYTTED